ncbi:MAG TPA: hypothetical protein PKD80_02110 [Microthrixaceae bacterium]|jgi:hypothetical protein|nr:hypothetical protein [Microthrixaceae bacterium]HMT25286.1 hypothetical protein [Microthrixaceae bacterium]HMT59276.1 hypothetical protein [Microthrixaceae bacterium]
MSTLSQQFVAGVSAWGLRRDSGAGVDALDDTPIGWRAQCWAVLKSAVVAGTATVWIPTIASRAARNHRRALRTMHRPAPGTETMAGQPHTTALDWPANIRLVVVSDLHRCIPGRLDVPRRQQTKPLYDAMLEHYGTAGWHLCENGDIEDMWIVGGSTYGAVYDALRITGGLLARLGRPSLRVENYRRFLRVVTENNRSTYDAVRRWFVQPGRYGRTIGNHDGPLRHPSLAEAIRPALGAFRPVDAIRLHHPDGSLAAVVTHGHHGDGWNAPGQDNLGKLSAWLANTLADLPSLDTPEGLPPEQATRTTVDGELPNRLIRVSGTFGANSRYDSLDEEALFAAVHACDLDSVWFLLGHTHSPVRSPQAGDGRTWERYANAGSGITPSMITAIEWDGTAETPTVTLVAWVWSDVIDQADDAESAAGPESGAPRRARRVVLTPRPGGGLDAVPD